MRDPVQRRSDPQAEGAERGRRPRRFMIQLACDEAERAHLESSLQRLLRAEAPDASLLEVDADQELPWPELSFLALDTETTGLDAQVDRVIELAWVRFERGAPTARYSQLLRSDRSVPEPVGRLTGIDDQMLQHEPTFADVAPDLVAAVGNVDFIAAYHAPFDRAFLERELARIGQTLPEVPWVDPLVFIKEVDRYKPGKRLSDASRRWGVEVGRPHRALDDSLATGELLLRVGPFLPARSLGELLEHQERWRERQRAEAAARDTPGRGSPRDRTGRD